jgi:hypothetical protein
MAFEDLLGIYKKQNKITCPVTNTIRFLQDRRKCGNWDDDGFCRKFPIGGDFKCVVDDKGE